MEYLHLFNNRTEHDAVYNGGGYNEPWVGYITADTMVTYNKPHDYSKDYFTIEALEDGNVYFKYLQFATTEDQRYIEYSKDNGETWVRTTNVTGEEVIMTIPLLTGEKALVRGNNDTFGAYYEDEDMWFGSFFYSDIEFNVYGNIMSLIHGEDFIGEINAAEFMFVNLFWDKWGQFDSVGADCMVANANNLILPATILTNGCYSNMFNACTSLTKAPELQATTLDSYCYEFMFYGCTSLAAAPELPATTLAEACYLNMFDGCTSLTTAPELPATTLADYCYESMFIRCTSLTTAPVLLPATTLAYYCYRNMFNGCTSLTTAPELPATTLASYCYYNMFSSCANLNYIKAMFTTTPSATYTGNWVTGVASSGTFVKNSAATWNVTGVDGIPTGWTIQTASA